MCEIISQLMCKNMFLKRDVRQHCVAQKTGNRSPFIYIFDTIYLWKIILSYWLAKVPSRPKVGKRTPPPSNLGGL